MQHQLLCCRVAGVGRVSARQLLGVAQVYFVCWLKG